MNRIQFLLIVCEQRFVERAVDPFFKAKACFLRLPSAVYSEGDL